MNIAKVYKDSNVVECTIHQMEAREGYWAVIRIQAGEEAIKKVGLLIQEVKELRERLTRKKGT